MVAIRGVRNFQDRPVQFVIDREFDRGRSTVKDGEIGRETKVRAASPKPLQTQGRAIYSDVLRQTIGSTTKIGPNQSEPCISLLSPPAAGT